MYRFRDLRRRRIRRALRLPEPLFVLDREELHAALGVSRP